MSTDLNINALFTSSGCLSQQALILYAEGRLTEDDLKRVKGHLDSCPLCKDAAEGISMIIENSYRPGKADKPAGSTADEITTTVEDGSGSTVLSDFTDRINSRLRRKFAYFPAWKKASRQGPGLRNLLIPAAAAILVLIGIISYFHFLFPESNELAMVTEDLTVSEDQEKGKAATIGGIFKEDKAEKPEPEKYEPETTVPEKERTAENATKPLIDNDDVAEAAETIVTEEELVMVEPEDKAGKDEAVVPEKTVTVLEDMAAGGAETKQDFAASRAKSGKRSAAVSNEMIVVYDQNASFPGGKDSLYRFLNTFMKYDVVTEEMADTVILIKFVVSRKGSISDFYFIQGAGDKVNDEVLRVLGSMPDWIPAIKEGKNVEETVNLPIYLKLN